ncbi:MAG: C45 family peptidase [Pseudomonadota bacterium]
MTMEYRTLDEAELGPKWQGAFEAIWPAYRGWFLSQGEEARPTYREVARALKAHMPEWVPAWEQMSELAGGGDYAARFLGQLSPPPFFAACSQAILPGDPAAGQAPLLVRNYDYSPLLCDGLVMKTHWLKRGVIAMTDCMSGVLDGMNDDGLAISLTFGGRRVTGQGFSITMIQRYILETCSTVAEACAALQRLPLQVAYNVGLLDRDGDFATVLLSPDRPAQITQRRVITNHQDGDRWQKYTDMIQSDERLDYLTKQLEAGPKDPEDLLGLFLKVPLYRTTYGMGYGTLFTSVYCPARGEVRYLWPDGGWHLTFDEFPEQSRTVLYQDFEASNDDKPVWPPQELRQPKRPMGIFKR